MRETLRGVSKHERCQTHRLPGRACDGQVKRLLGTGGGIIFKGAGFYQTDYRSSSYQAGAKADGAPRAPPPPPLRRPPAAPAHEGRGVRLCKRAAPC